MSVSKRPSDAVPRLAVERRMELGGMTRSGAMCQAGAAEGLRAGVVAAAYFRHPRYLAAVRGRGEQMRLGESA